MNQGTRAATGQWFVFRNVATAATAKNVAVHEARAVTQHGNGKEEGANDDNHAAPWKHPHLPAAKTVSRQSLDMSTD